MKPPRQKAVGFILPLMLLIGFMVMTWPASIALDIDPAGQSSDTPESAKNIPVSTVLMRLKFTVDGDRAVYAWQFDGGLIRIEREGAFIYGFSPYMTDKGSGEVSIRVFQIGRIIGQDGNLVGESIKELETVKAGASGNQVTAYKDANSNFTIEILEVKKDYELKDPAITRDIYSGDQCCISCNGLTTCACAVSTNCGDCCRRACCPILNN